MNIYIVTMYSSGERWHTLACASFQAVSETLELSYGMTLEHGHPEGEYIDYRNLRDISQTAVAQKVRLIE